MEIHPNYAAVGAFVLGLLICIVAFIIWTAKFDFKGDTQDYEIFFEGSVAGLKENEAVRYLGIPIGAIKNLNVDKENPQRIRVVVRINEPSLIREDSIASIEIKSLTGYAFIQIEGGSSYSPILKAQKGKLYPIIPSKQSKIEAIFSDAPKVLKRLTKLTKTLDHFFDDQNRAAFHEMLTETRDSFKTLRTSLEQFNQNMDEIKEEMKLTLNNINVMSQSMNHATKKVDRFMEQNHDSIDHFTTFGLKEITRLTEQANTTFLHLNRILKQVDASPSDFLHKNLNDGYVIK